jgi:hypothetical protein
MKTLLQEIILFFEITWLNETDPGYQLAYIPKWPVHPI